jgi:hypothetical protein
MKRALLFVVMLWVLALAFASASHSAMRSEPAPELNSVASQISGQEVTVRCYLNDGQDPDSMPDAWGYVYLWNPVVFLSPEACAGAEALVSGEMLPLWELGLGSLVLTHESYHLKTALPMWRRGDEAQTECRAVKRVRQTMLDLGASQQLADAILPWSIAEHFKIETLGDGSYNYPSCKVPVFSDFWP